MNKTTLSLFFFASVVLGRGLQNEKRKSYGKSLMMEFCRTLLKVNGESRGVALLNLLGVSKSREGKRSADVTMHCRYYPYCCETKE